MLTSQKVLDDMIPILEKGFEGDDKPDVRVKSILSQKRFKAENGDLVLIQPPENFDRTNKGNQGEMITGQCIVDVRMVPTGGTTWEDLSDRFSKVLEIISGAFSRYRLPYRRVDEFDDVSEFNADRYRINTEQDLSDAGRIRRQEIQLEVEEFISTFDEQEAVL